MRILVTMLLICGFSTVAFAQTKIVTNADLEKFRVKRLAAEKELRENYKEMGFSSPEERAKKIAQSAEENRILSEKLRKERLARQAQNTSVRDSRVVYINPVTPRQQTGFIDYSQYRSSSVFYVNRRLRRSPLINIQIGTNPRLRRGNQVYRQTRRPRLGRVVPSNGNNPAGRIGPDRRMTRQNLINSKKNDIRNFGPAKVIKLGN